jgi:hypothetical protein
MGRAVARLAEGNYNAGTHRVIFDGTQLPSDIYFCSLTTGKDKMTRKLAIVK